MLFEVEEIWDTYEANLSSGQNSSSFRLDDLNSKINRSALVMFSLLGLITVSALLIIGLLAYIFKKNKSLIKNSVNIFILNIIFVDLLRCLVQAPVFGISIRLSLGQLVGSNQNFPPIVVACNLNMTLGVLFEVVQLLSFLGISYERFKIVHSPFLNPNKRVLLAKLLVAFTWLFSVCLTICIMFAVSFISDYRNFSTQSQSCYLDMFSLTIDTYYSPSSQVLVYDGLELSLRNRQIDFIAYFYAAICLLSFTLSGYFYARIILFLKIHEEKVLVTLRAKIAGKVEPVEVSLSAQTTLEMPKPSRFAIVNETGEIIQSKNETSELKIETTQSQIALVSGDEQKDVIAIHGEEGTVVMLKKTDAACKKIEGDICIANGAERSKNREKGRRRLEVRTAKKTFFILLSFLSCQLMFLLSKIVHKLPIFTQNGQIIEHFYEHLFALSQLGIYFSIFSFLSCFFNAFTFISVTEFFKIEAIREIKMFKIYLLSMLKRSEEN